MATLTAYSTSADGYVRSESATYSTARSGAGLIAPTNTQALIVGQQFSGGIYYCPELCLDFDTSSIPDDAVISAVDLSMYGFADFSDTEFDIEVRLHDWGASLTTADWVAGADLGGKTLLASRSSAGLSTAGYNAFTENGSNFRDNINKTGVTRILICSNRHRVGNTPTGEEWAAFYSADDADAGKYPKLVVTYTTSTTHAAAAALSAAVTLTPLAGLTFTPGAALAAAATLSPLATGEVLAAAVLPGSGTLTADGNIGTLLAASALVGSAALAAVAAPLVKNAAAALAASALLTASATRIAPIKTVSLGAGFTSSSRQHGGVAT